MRRFALHGWKFAVIAALLILAAGNLAVAQNDPNPAPQIQANEEKPAVTLSIAVVLNAPGPTFAFTVTNNSKTDFPYYEPGLAPIVFIRPDGEETQYILAVTRAPGFKQPVVKPGESITSKRDMFEKFGGMRFKMAGTYRVYWTLREQQNGKWIEYKSNEIPIHREKGTPIFHSGHGRALPEEFYKDNPEYQ